jgi:uncharacterized protein (TIRG00374 family)
MALTLLFMFAHLLIKFLRYQYILIQQQIWIPFIKTIRFSLASMYLSYVTPGRVGEVSKAYFIHKENGSPLNKLVAGSLMDRAFDVYTLLCVAILGIAVMIPMGMNQFPVILAIALIALTPLLFLIKTAREMFIAITGMIQRKITRSDTWPDHLRFFFAEINILLNRKIILGFAVSFTAYALFFTSCYFMSRSIDIPLTYTKVAFFVAYANILSFLPISFAGIGTREAAFVYLFSLENIASESALAFSTMVFSFTYLLIGIIGFFCFTTLNYNKESILDNT